MTINTTAGCARRTASDRSDLRSIAPTTKTADRSVGALTAGLKPHSDSPGRSPGHMMPEADSACAPALFAQIAELTRTGCRVQHQGVAR